MRMCVVCGDWLVCQTISVCNNPVACILWLESRLARNVIRTAILDRAMEHWTPWVDQGRVRLSAEPAFCACHECVALTLKRPGGGWINPPLDIFRDHSAARNFLTAPLADFLLSSLAHLMTPFSRKSGIPLRRCTTFYTSSSDQKWLKNVILCQCKWSFLTLFIKIWLFSLSLAEINSF